MVREVLAGRRVARSGFAEAKVLRILLGKGDVRVDASAIELLWPMRRIPFRYYVVLAPWALGEMLDRAKLKRLEVPTVAALRKAPIPDFVSNPEIVDLCAWFFPEPDAIRILLRERETLPASPLAIPDSGPFALPEPLPPWSPTEPKYLDEAVPRPCPHCRTEATRYRDLGDALICLTCGRSFAR